MVMATRAVTVRDYAIFMAKLWLDGLKDATFIVLSTGALILDMISGAGRRPRAFYSVVRLGEKFDKWLNLHAAVERLESQESPDGFFGGSDAGSDSLLGKIEQVVRGGDEPRSPGKRRVSGPEDRS